MQLPHPLRLNNHIRARNRLRHREIRTINLPPLSTTTRRGLRRVTERTIHITRITSKFARFANNSAISCLSAIQDIRIRARDRIEHRLRETERLREDGFRGLGEPVVEVEGRACAVKVAVVECEEIFVLVVEALHGVCLAFGKVPDVAEGEFGGLVPPVFVDGGDEDAAEEDLAPFCLLDS